MSSRSSTGTRCNSAVSRAFNAASGLVWHENLVWICTTAMIWIFLEWLIFYTRVWFDLPHLEITRSVNGRTEPRGFLQAGRRVVIEVHVSAKRGRLMVGEQIGLGDGAGALREPRTLTHDYAI